MYFAKHQTFHIRDGWLHKGMKAVMDEPTIFLAEEAPELLGLGKNMVEALRFWMQATGLTKEDFEGGRKAQTLTPLGQHILASDPYQELDGTLWLIHHQLVSSRDFATSWYWFFNHYVPTRFEAEDFIDHLDQWINIQDDVDKQYSHNTLRRDFDCLVRTYLKSDRETSPEDLMESPLASLGLLSVFSERDERTHKKFKVYRFEQGDPKTISPLVLLYVLLSSQEQMREHNQQVPIQIALREAKNVGRTFNIGITTLETVLSELADLFPEWRVLLTRTSGLDQMTLPKVSADRVLETYYDSQRAVEQVVKWEQPLA